MEEPPAPTPPAPEPPGTEPLAWRPPPAAPQPPPPPTSEVEPTGAPAPQAPAKESPPLLVRWFLRARPAAPPAPSEPGAAPVAEPPPAEPEPAPAEPEPTVAEPEPEWALAEPEAEPDEAEPAAAKAVPVARAADAIGDAVQEAAITVGRVPVAASRGARRFWSSLSVQTRRRLELASAVLAVLLVIVFVAVPALPCQAPGGDVCAPSDDAVALVPDDSLAYVHVNVDPGTEQYDNARTVAGRIPALTAQATSRLLSRVPGPGGGTLDFAQDVQPWFGGQAALALVPAGGRAADEVELLQVSDDGGAKKFADSIVTGSPETTTYRDIPVSVDKRGLATALVDGFLAIGRESGVRDVIDAQSGAEGTGSLTDNEGAKAALDALPAERLADAYLSPDGIDRLVGNPRGSLATLAAFVDPGASTGAAVAVVASDTGLNVDIRSELDPARADAHPGFFSAFPSFQPTLTSSLPADSLAYAGIGDPEHTITSLLDQASSEQPGIAAGVGSLLERIRKLGKVDIERSLLPSLGEEAAFALQPSKSGSGTPYLEFLASGVDPAKAGDALASLQGPIADALSPSSGQAPSFSDEQVGDVTAHSVRLSPTVNLTYAIVESILVVATDPAAVAQLGGEGGGLADDSSYQEATDGLPGSASVLAYLNLTGLIALAERAGLAQDPSYQTFASEIQRLQALGLAVQQSPSELATDVRLVVGDQLAPAALPGAQGGPAPQG